MSLLTALTIDPSTAAALPGRIAAAADRLPRLRALADEIAAAAPSLLPPGVPEWRSGAADLYRGRLEALRARIGEAVAGLDAASAIAERELAALEDDLAAHRAEQAEARARAAAPVHAQPGGVR